jgi:hypothetical protein
MKKFIINLSLVAVIALVPAVMVAYLHQTPADQKTEMAKDSQQNTDEAGTLRLVKTF